jgi:uracil phosphoribosyltransferase
MIHIYEADYVKPLVKVFYERAWKNTEETRRIFEEIGFELTKYAFRNVPLLKNLQKNSKVFAGPIARAGCGLFRPSVINYLRERLKESRICLETFGVGLSRSHDPIRLPAKTYWNTLRYFHKKELSSSLFLLYEMGEATGSTIEGVINELKKFDVSPKNILFLIGVACIDQTKERLESFADSLQVVIGSRWKYDEEPGPTQFYVTQIFEDKWIKITPRDWGRCVSGMKDHSSVMSFINWIEETVNISEEDKEMLFTLWLKKIGEKRIG